MKFKGSTSSVTPILSQIYYLFSRGKSCDVSMLPTYKSIGTYVRCILRILQELLIYLFLILISHSLFDFSFLSLHTLSLSLVCL